MQLSDGVCQKHRPLVFLAGLLLVMGYATYINQSISKILLECGQLLFYICYTIYFIA
jgi:uncharacterized membrane protein